MGLSDRQRAGSDAPNGIRRWDGSPWTTVPSTVVGAEKALVERRLVSACAGVFAPLTAGMGLAGFTRS